MKTLVFLLSLLSLFSCSNPENSSSVATSSLAAMASWGSYLYMVGGLDCSGQPSAQVWRSSVTQGKLTSWVREGDLPQGLVSPTVLAANQQLYVMGGKTASGFSRTVLYTLINSDGHLGYSNSIWQTGVRPLAEAEAGAAVFTANGRAFLAGGTTSQGPTDHVWDAQLWKDGELGNWYIAPPLPFTEANPTVTAWGGPSGTVELAGESSFVTSSFGLTSLPWSWTSSPLPASLVAPLIAETPSGILLAGLTVSDHLPVAWLNSGSGWKAQTLGDLAGPSSAEVGGELWAVSSNSPPILNLTPLLPQTADAPKVYPPSGNIPANTRIGVSAFPGDTVTWTSAPWGTLPPDPTATSTDTLWDSASPAFVQVTVAQTYAFRAFRSGAAPSRIVYESYQPSASSLFSLLSGSIYLGALTLSTYTLTQPLSNGTQPVSTVMYSFVVPTDESVTFKWADKTTLSTYTAPVKVSLLESDLLTPAQLSDGSAFFQRQDGTLTLTLQAGQYYISVGSTDGSSGTSFGLAVGTP